MLDSINGHIRGKPEVIELSLICLLAQGHLLLEDVPGTGKTSLAGSLARASGLPWRRIQFTPDVLPSDITGASIFHPGKAEFAFHPGPVFTSIVLADEINRASPRTQAALLEAMEERTVSVDGVTRQVPWPFMVVATQNPIDMAGTYPLPEAQLDRFLMRTSMGYPSHEAEVEVLGDHQAGHGIDDVTPSLDGIDLQALIQGCEKVDVEPSVLDYIVRIVAATRSARGVVLGASPRGSVALLRAARARAFVHGRDYVVPGDVQVLAEPVLAHRLVLDADALASGVRAGDVISEIIATVAAPQPPGS